MLRESAIQPQLIAIIVSPLLSAIVALAGYVYEAIVTYSLTILTLLGFLAYTYDKLKPALLKTFTRALFLRMIPAMLFALIVLLLRVLEPPIIESLKSSAVKNVHYAFDVLIVVAFAALSYASLSAYFVFRRVYGETLAQVTVSAGAALLVVTLSVLSALGPERSSVTYWLFSVPSSIFLALTVYSMVALALMLPGGAYTDMFYGAAGLVVVLVAAAFSHKSIHMLGLRELYPAWAVVFSLLTVPPAYLLVSAARRIEEAAGR